MVIIILIIMPIYFTVTEIAFSSIDKIRLKNLTISDNRRAQQVLELSKKYDPLLSNILISNNIANILSNSLATPLFTIYFPKIE